jgi:hypothetical protein
MADQAVDATDDFDNSHAIWEGEELVIGSRRYILAPLNFAGMERFGKKLKKLNELDEDQKIDLFFEVILWCFRRNYPTMTMQRLKDMADLKNFTRMRDIALGTSGFKAEIGSGKAPAENQPT